MSLSEGPRLCPTQPGSSQVVCTHCSQPRRTLLGPPRGPRNIPSAPKPLLLWPRVGSCSSDCRTLFNSYPNQPLRNI